MTGEAKLRIGNYSEIEEAGRSARCYSQHPSTLAGTLCPELEGRLEWCYVALEP
ncbi:hypothetical protein Rrhod_2520 [Rhodococcus rhodnii LMG 5362]|uniref:Uncharacterized protein n=1 Tax=Rhodococcus rhodnii LMG 5362 TaxID=1273125 RepID=R7WQ83_9NOCA|nr:hypothetical protein Rrhod_2520 [Rhodococcus rhodnii LMG 5362]